MRILVYPHDLVMGGSQINAIDLAARARDRGHVVELYAPPGQLESLIHDRSLPHRVAPSYRAQSLRLELLRSFANQVRRFRPDIVHTYESPAAIVSAAVAPFVPHRSVVTVLSMSVPDYIPDDVPLFVGTRLLADELSGRTGPVHLMEPPIDVEADSPTDSRRCRHDLHIPDDALVVAVVGRLSTDLEKARGVVAAISELAHSSLVVSPIHLVVAGTGDEEHTVRAATAMTDGHPHLTVRLEGNVQDPRGIYNAADVVFGMGSSALRAMAHAKPVIVQGRNGYWKLLTPDNSQEFLSNGFFGDGHSGGPSLSTIVHNLQAHPLLRKELGTFGRELVVERFSLEHATDALLDVYQESMMQPLRPAMLPTARALFRYTKFRVAHRAPGLQSAVRRIRGNR